MAELEITKKIFNYGAAWVADWKMLLDIPVKKEDDEIGWGEICVTEIGEYFMSFEHELYDDGEKTYFKIIPLRLPCDGYMGCLGLEPDDLLC